MRMIATAARRLAAAHSGFTMIVTIGVMFVAGLLTIAAFTAANSDVHLSHHSTAQQQAYYAALAGIQEYEYKLEKEPNYWETCEAPSSSVPEQKVEHYEITLLAANGTTEGCKTSEPFKTMIESTGAAANTFRIESTGCAGAEGMTTCLHHGCTGSGETLKRCEERNTSQVAEKHIVASFAVSGFLQYVYFTRYEDEDPTLYNPKVGAAACEKYYEGGKRSSECVVIRFVTGDSVNGPMHTDDTAAVCGEPEFGRSKHTPADQVQINGGLNEVCAAKPIFNTENGKYSVGKEIYAPENDSSLLAYVESANKFSGVTQLVLNGTTNEISVTTKGETKSVPWPANGLIYVEKGAGACGYAFTAHGADTPKESSTETNCGNVYVHGTYSKSLTIAAENDVIVNGSVYPKSVEGKLSAENPVEPSGTATLGLIATHFVRVYHPVAESYAATKGFKGYECPKGGTLEGTSCLYENSQENCEAPELNEKEDPNKWGSQKNIWIYAAILSTKHSFVVDNYNCGSPLGELNLYGAIAQNFRGIVGTGGSGGTGYIKNYNYDQRLATDEPPYFLQPLNTGWEVERETASANG